MTVGDVLTALQALPRDAERLAFEAGWTGALQGRHAGSAGPALSVPLAARRGETAPAGNPP
jgi:hypothetical protein